MSIFFFFIINVPLSLDGKINTFNLIASIRITNNYTLDINNFHIVLSGVINNSSGIYEQIFSTSVNARNTSTNQTTINTLYERLDSITITKFRMGISLSSTTSATFNFNSGGSSSVNIVNSDYGESYYTGNLVLNPSPIENNIYFGIEVR